MPPYSCFCAVKDSHYNLEWYIQTSAIVSNKRVSQETHRQLHSDFKTTDVTIPDYPTQFIDFQRGQHHHSSNMKYQATSSPTTTHVVNDQSDFSNRTHTHYLHCCPACKNIPHTSEQFNNTPAQHFSARQIDVHQAKYHDKRRELLTSLATCSFSRRPQPISTEAYGSRITHYPGPAIAHSSLSIPSVCTCLCLTIRLDHRPSTTTNRWKVRPRQTWLHDLCPNITDQQLLRTCSQEGQTPQSPKRPTPATVSCAQSQQEHITTATVNSGIGCEAKRSDTRPPRPLRPQ